MFTNFTNSILTCSPCSSGLVILSKSSKTPDVLDLDLFSPVLADVEALV